jgi:hypothetical protein
MSIFPRFMWLREIVYVCHTPYLRNVNDFDPYWDYASLITLQALGERKTKLYRIECTFCAAIQQTPVRSLKRLNHTQRPFQRRHGQYDAH